MGRRKAVLRYLEYLLKILWMVEECKKQEAKERFYLISFVLWV